MKIRSNLVLLALAMVLSLVTTLLILHRLSAVLNNPAGTRSVSVVVVKHMLGDHQVVTSNDVDVERVPAIAEEPGAITAIGDVVGHFTATRMFPGQQVVAGMVTGLAESASFPLLIPQGERAVTIADDPVTGVDHLISPGDRVDVLVSYSDSGAKLQTVKTVLQNILVLYVDVGPSVIPSASSGTHSTVTTGSSKFDTITLAVTPLESEKLDFGYTFGQLHVTLRNPSDMAVNTIPNVVGPNS